MSRGAFCTFFGTIKYLQSSEMEDEVGGDLPRDVGIKIGLENISKTG